MVTTAEKAEDCETHPVVSLVWHKRQKEEAMKGESGSYEQVD